MIIFPHMPAPTSTDQSLDAVLHTFRGHRVILDADLARLYGVMTGALNQAMKRNSDRFPSDFAFQLIPEEIEVLNRSQIATASPQDLSGDSNLSQIVIGSEERVEILRKPPGNRSQFVTGSRKAQEFHEKSKGNRSQIAIGSQKHRDPRLLPWAFTEHGALMAATVLRSPRAVQMSLYVVRAFVKLREIASENQGLSRRVAEAELALREHDSILVDIYDKLEPLLEPSLEQPPKRTMGFRKEE